MRHGGVVRLLRWLPPVAGTITGIGASAVTAARIGELGANTP
jgi:hypothetical protein